MLFSGMPPAFPGSLLLFLAGILSRPDAGTLAPKPGAEAWTAVDFQTATCGYAPSNPLTFSIPPGYIVRNPNHGAQMGCLWGIEEDLDRALVSPLKMTFGKLDHGVFQARPTGNIEYDAARGRFTGEEQMGQVFAEAGIRDARITHHTFASRPGLVITGRRADGFELYMLYLACGAGDDVILINYRPATPPTYADAENWRRFLEAIR